MLGIRGGKGSMGNKRNAWKKLAMAVAVPGVAVGTLAGVAAGPPMAATAHPHGSPIETISGGSSGSSGTVNVQASGVFHDWGYVNLNSNSPFTEVHLGHGSLCPVHNQGHTSTTVSPGDC